MHDPDPVDELAARLQTTLRGLEPHPDLVATLTSTPRRTIEPPRRAIDPAAMALFVERAGVADELLEREDELGRGGMGVVHRARDLLMGRRVAVKDLLPAADDDVHALRLLQEGWLTGLLEHPNIVRVYSIAKAEGDRPSVIMQHIEGQRWSRLMHDAEEVARRFGTRDLLEWNLRILMAVCNAVHFAHSRGVLHRDLKADNVMIGAFGEVYLMDWGISIALEPDSAGRLPQARPDEGMAGTPRYMAPEMVGGRSAEQGPATDVYLLGGMIYEIMHRRGPHQGKTVLEIVTSILTSEPVFNDKSPALARICRKAMAREPDARYPSAEALRRALEEFLRQRGSLRLSDDARARLEQLILALEEGRRSDVQRLFGACSFGFQAALDAWPGNATAAAGLREARLRIVAHHLDLGELGAAAALLAELEDPPTELRERLAALRRAAREEEERLAALRRLHKDRDPTIGRETRLIFVVVMGLVWAASPYVARLLGLPPPLEGLSNALAFDGAFLAILVVLGVVRRQQVFATGFNRSLYQTLVFLIACQALLVVAGHLAALEAVQVTALHFFLWTTILGMVSIFVSARLWPSTVFYLGAFFWVLVDSEQRFLAMSLVNLFLIANIVLIWRPVTAEQRAVEEGG